MTFVREDIFEFKSVPSLEIDFELADRSGGTQ